MELILRYLILLPLAFSAAVNVARHDTIAPAPAPASAPSGAPGPAKAKGFFNTDYIFDHRPQVDKDFAFGHPYPVVQDSGDFSKDYVKDENKDAGEWNAQMNYDVLRSKLRKQRKDLEKVQAKSEIQTSEYEEAVKRHETMKHEVTHTKEKDDTDSKKVQEAEAKVKEVQEEKSNDGKDSSGKADAVEKETSELEECQKELKKAKGHLKDLLVEREKALKAKDAADAAAKDRLKAANSAEDHEELLEGTVVKEQKDYDAAVKDHEQKVQELEAAKKRLEAAEGKVRDFRNSVDADGGVYPSGGGGLQKPRIPSFKNAAFHPGLLLSVALVVVAAMP